MVSRQIVQSTASSYFTVQNVITVFLVIATITLAIMYVKKNQSCDSSKCPSCPVPVSRNTSWTCPDSVNNVAFPPMRLVDGVPQCASADNSTCMWPTPGETCWVQLNKYLALPKSQQYPYTCTPNEMSDSKSWCSLAYPKL